MVHATVVGSSSQIWRQMIFHIYNLSHILHLMSNSLISCHIYSILSTGSEVSNAWGVKILILRCWAMSLELIELELIFIWSSTDTSFINMMCANSSMSFLFDELAIQWLISHLLLRVHLLVLISAMILHVTRKVGLLVITSCLWSSFQLILYLLLLFFIWISDLYSLANLLELRSIKRMHLLMWVHHYSAFMRGILKLLSIIYQRIIYSVSWVSLWWAWSITSLSCNFSLSLRPSRLSSYLALSWLTSIKRYSRLNLSSLILLLLHHHFLLNLLLMKLLRWSKIEIVDNICNVCYSIIWCVCSFRILQWLILSQKSLLIPIKIPMRLIYCPINIFVALTCVSVTCSIEWDALKSILNNFPILTRNHSLALVSLMSSTFPIYWSTFVFRALIHKLIFISKIDNLLLIHKLLLLNILARQMFTIWMICSNPWVN